MKIKRLKRKHIPGIVSVSITMLAFVASTVYLAFSGGYDMGSYSVLTRIVVSLFVSCIFSALWCAILALFVASPLYFLLGYRLTYPVKPSEMDEYGIWIMGNWALSSVLFAIQFFLFGTCFPLFFTGMV